MPAPLRLASGALTAIGSLAALRTAAAVPARATVGDIEVALSDVEKRLTALHDTTVAFKGTWSETLAIHDGGYDLIRKVDHATNIVKAIPSNSLTDDAARRIFNRLAALLPLIKAGLGALKDHKDKFMALLPNFLAFLGHPNDVVLAGLMEMRTSIDQCTLAIMVIVPATIRTDAERLALQIKGCIQDAADHYRS